MHGGWLRIDPLTNAGNMLVDSGGNISVTGATTDTGSIVAGSSGTVYLGGAVSGSGTTALQIDGGNLVLGSSDSCNIVFYYGQLTLDNAAAMTGTIDFDAPYYNPTGDILDLAGTIVTNVRNTGSALVMTESNGQVLGLVINNLGFNYAGWASDESGGTLIYFTPGTATDMLMRNSSNGALELYEVGGNTIQGAASIGTVGLNWQVAGFGGFSSRTGEADMLMRNSSNGAFEVYDIANNALASAASMGAVGLELDGRRLRRFLRQCQ